MNKDQSASQLIAERIAELGDWRGETLSRMRELIKEADPEVVEEWKWRKATSPGTPVWSHNGGICTGETYKSVVKLTFFKGASAGGPGRALQLEPRGEHQTRHRYPRGKGGRRSRVQGADPRSGRGQHAYQRKGREEIAAGRGSGYLLCRRHPSTTSSAPWAHAKWLIIATDVGVFRTTNLGKTWIKVRDNLPLVPINDIDLPDGSNTLYAATYGRSVWTTSLADSG